MKPKVICLIVDNLTMKQLMRKSDKAVTCERKKIRLKFGLTAEEKITTYHLAEFWHTPLSYIESHLN